MAEGFRFRVNQKMRLSALTPAGVRQYFTVVQEVFDDRFLVTVPQEKGDYVLFRRGESMQAAVFDSMGVCTFDTKVIGRLDLSLPMYVLERPADARTFQRRQAPRTCAYLPVSYEYHRGETPVRVLGWTRDIGTGGLCLSAAEKPEASFLRLSVELPQDDGTVHIPCRGEVRSARTDAYTGKVLCGVMFRGLEPEEEELITRYVSRSERLTI